MPYDDARRTARRLESAADAEIAAYAKLAAAADDSFAGGERGLSAQQLAAAKAAAVDKLLAELDGAVAELQREASRDGGGDTTARSHTAARAASVAADLRARFTRLSASVAAAQERAALFGGASPSTDTGGGGTRGALLRERGVLASAHAALDDVLGVASATGTSLLDQRGRLGGAAGRLASVGDRFPVIGGLLAAIRRRRDRDAMVVAGVAGACTFLTVVYWLHK